MSEDIAARNTPTYAKLRARLPRGNESDIVAFQRGTSGKTVMLPPLPFVQIP